MNATGMRSALLSMAVLLCLGCATRTPRVTEVTRVEKQMTISPADEPVFAEDRASHIRIRPQALPEERQGEDFLVRWQGTGITRVTFEYRQLNLPNVVEEQVVTPAPQSLVIFRIRGDAYDKGGKVSAWRVRLWTAADTTQPSATKQSALW